MKRDKTKCYIKSLQILVLRLIRWVVFSMFWVLGFGIAIGSISLFGWIIGGIPGVIIAGGCIFIGGIIAGALGRMIERVTPQENKETSLNSEKISDLKQKQAEYESVRKQAEECKQQENTNRDIICTKHYRDRADYIELARLCKLGDIVAMYDMAQFFYNLCNDDERELIKNYEMNPCDTTENKLREAMNYSKWEKFEPENNRMGYYMMWLVRAAMYGNEKAIELTEKCSCYKRKASIPYDFYLGKSSTMDFNISNFLSDGGFSDVPPAEKDCTLKRYGNIYKLTYLSYYDSADPDGYGSETEYSNVYYDEFFMKLDTKQKNEMDRITRASMTAEESVKEIFAEGRKREKAIETNERIREEYWEKQPDSDVRKYKTRLKSM